MGFRSKWFFASLTMVLMGLTACGSQSGTSKDDTGESPRPKGGKALPAAIDLSNAEGIWMEASDAGELRETGKLTSQCEEVKKKPDDAPTSVRLIDGSGVLSIIYPTKKNPKLSRMGVLSPSGEIILEDDFKTRFGQAKMEFELQGDTLEFVFVSGKFRAGLPYVRSSQLELVSYYSALAQCRK